MTWTPPLYPNDYDGYRYTNPTVPGPPITAESMKQAWDEGRAACAARPRGGPRPANPYAGLSQTLDAMWRNGYTVEDEPRQRRLTELEDQQAEPGVSASLAAELADTFDVSRMPSALKTYWLRGAGAAKIRWGTPGDFNRCRVAINKEIVEDGRAPLSDRVISGLCSNLHVEATGGRPGTH